MQDNLIFLELEIRCAVHILFYYSLSNGQRARLPLNLPAGYMVHIRC
jgi:hypothetical protein